VFDAKAIDPEFAHANEARFSAICRVGDDYGYCRKFKPSLG